MANSPTRRSMPLRGPVLRPAGRPQDQRVYLSVAVTLAVLSGVVAAAVMPRGPTTPVAAVGLLMGVGLAGVAAGLLTRSRWAALFAPVLHLAGFEAARAIVFHPEGVAFGPVTLTTTAGVVVFVIGHGIYALVTMLPMVLGALGGVALARRTAPAPSRPPRPGGWRRVVGAVGRGLVVALSALLVVSVGWLGFQLARPATVAPVRDADGEVVPGSIATQERLRLGGVDQWVSIRGLITGNPVLLYLSGGPGGSDLALVRWNQRLEAAFTVVVWEQRGAGMSYPAIDPAASLTMEQLVSDGIQLTDWLRARFGEQKVYLVGNSWGTTLGVRMVQRNPELFHAFVGTGQMVSQHATDQILYEQTLAYTERTGARTTAAKLRSWGPPPWDDAMTDTLAHTTMALYYEDIEPYDLGATELPLTVLTDRFVHGEYSLLDAWNSLRGLADTFSVLYPQLQTIDFRESATRLAVPVYVLEGRNELSARRLPAIQWFEGLQAPSKQLVWFGRSGHNPQFEEATRYTDVMVDVVLAETYPDR